MKGTKKESYSLDEYQKTVKYFADNYDDFKTIPYADVQEALNKMYKNTNARNLDSIIASLIFDGYIHPSKYLESQNKEHLTIHPSLKKHNAEIQYEIEQKLKEKRRLFRQNIYQLLVGCAVSLFSFLLGLFSGSTISSK